MQATLSKNSFPAIQVKAPHKIEVVYNEHKKKEEEYQKIRQAFQKDSDIHDLRSSRMVFNKHTPGVIVVSPDTRAELAKEFSTLSGNEVEILPNTHETEEEEQESHRDEKDILHTIENE